MNKRLVKSQDKIVSGVCGGVADYFNLDPTVVRLGYVLLSICSSGFPGLIIYIVCALVMPEN